MDLHIDPCLIWASLGVNLSGWHPQHGGSLESYRSQARPPRVPLSTECERDILTGDT